MHLYNNVASLVLWHHVYGCSSILRWFYLFGCTDSTISHDSCAVISSWLSLLLSSELVWKASAVILLQNNVLPVVLSENWQWFESVPLVACCLMLKAPPLYRICLRVLKGIIQFHFQTIRIHYFEFSWIYLHLSGITFCLRVTRDVDLQCIEISWPSVRNSTTEI